MNSEKYSRLSLDEDDGSELLPGNTPTSSKQSKRVIVKKIALRIAGGIITILLLAWICLSIIERQRDHKSYEWVPCGNTPQSARAAGCHYEPMQRSWIPDACYFNEPSEEYNPYSDRAWFKDVNMTIPANIDLLKSGDETLAFTRYFHDEHCLYGWRKLGIAVEKKLPMIDSKSYNLHHTSHCARTIADVIQKSYDPKNGWFFERDYTKSPLMYQTCVPLRWK